MGLFDKLSEVANKAADYANMDASEAAGKAKNQLSQYSEAKSIAKQEKAEAKKALKEKQRNETSAIFKLASPSPATSGTFGVATIWKQQNGLVYFSDNVDTLYEVAGFEWDGPSYEAVITTEAVTEEQGKQKRTGRVTGAVVGTILAPGIGTAIGAAYGTGNKKLDKKGKTTTVQQTSQVENETIATLYLSDAYGNIVHVIAKDKAERLSELAALARTAQAARIAFNQQVQQTAQVQKADAASPYDELTKLKELMDSGVITEDDFNAAKARILGI
ncbi:MAG: SHOCT domain-containing protein [Eggerthellaceae bacterium]|nr:SHOCT domain-containing protein [Eggerthellaceae bacterium]